MERTDCPGCLYQDGPALLSCAKCCPPEEVPARDLAPVALLTDEQRREHAAPYRTPVQRMRDAARSRGPDPDEADAVCADEQRARRKDERRGR